MKLKYVLITLFLIGGAIALAAQWGSWRTGREVLDPLKLTPSDSAGSLKGRIWIDTDAACGATTRTDPDDCLAILWLAELGSLVAGISTSFGNAPGNVVADRTEALVARMKLEGLPVPPVFLGNGEPTVEGAAKSLGVTALQSALEMGPLTILALGPLTNVAEALEGRTDLNRNVTRIIAVMGHRPGHLFHPTEGSGAGAFFGHGPIFRDLNVSADPRAIAAVLALSVPITLIPYDAARETLINGVDMDRLARRNAVSAWVAGTTRDWLIFWKDEVGLLGFYPFDWIAAAYLTHPGQFRCATVTARMTRKWTFWIFPHASLVVEPSATEDSTARDDTLYCPETFGSLKETLMVP